MQRRAALCRGDSDCRADNMRIVDSIDIEEMWHGGVMNLNACGMRIMGRCEKRLWWRVDGAMCDGAQSRVLRSSGFDSAEDGTMCDVQRSTE